MTAQTGDWTEYYQKTTDLELVWPSETMVRVFKGDYVPDLNHDYAGKSVLDVGFGIGNNLIFLASLGLAVYGTELSEEICQIAGSKLSQRGYSATLKVGSNRQLPFPDNSFDFLTSWNVLHYEDNEEAICQAISEYKRVLKPGGRFFISTTGPDHKILTNHKALGDHRYQIGLEGDFRKVKSFTILTAKTNINKLFGAQFGKVIVGRTHDRLFTSTLDWFIISAVKE